MSLRVNFLARGSQRRLWLHGICEVALPWRSHAFASYSRRTFARASCPHERHDHYHASLSADVS